jgi:protein-S-isoprenylcysteine O-methyltransferase Ste14
MNTLRHTFGVLCVIVLPSGVLYWFLIHPSLRTYLIVLPVVIALGTVAYKFREPLLGKDLGTNWVFLGIALLFYASTTWFEFQYWKQINIATLIGVTELSATGHETGKLAREGIYARVRHPRYASAGLGLIGNVLLINYLGLYILFLLLIVVGIGLLALEERELVDRFGEAYRQYQREVPRFIPRLRRRP